MEKQPTTKRCPSCQENVSSNATKCPYCGKDFRGWFRRHPILTTLLVLFVIPNLLGGIFSLFSPDKKISSSNEVPETGGEVAQEKNVEEERKKLEEEKQKNIDNLGHKFCENRQGEYVHDIFFCSGCIDLNEIIDGLDRIHNAKSPATQENCEKIAVYCLALWNENECQKIAEQKIWLGMSKDQLLLSWGVPKDVNNSIGSWGVHSQWVYDSFGPYVYLEGESETSLAVTSWQD
jgi:hypothetical protein